MNALTQFLNYSFGAHPIDWFALLTSAALLLGLLRVISLARR